MQWYSILIITLTSISMVGIMIFSYLKKYHKKTQDEKFEDVGVSYKQKAHIKDVELVPLNIENDQLISNEYVVFKADINIYSVEKNRIYKGDSRSSRMMGIPFPMSMSQSDRKSLVEAEWSKQDYGSIFVTNKKIMLLGTKKTYNLSFKTIKNTEIFGNKKIIFRTSRVTPYMAEFSSKKDLEKFLCYFHKIQDL